MTGSRRSAMVFITLLLAAGWTSAQAANSAVEEMTRVMPDDALYFIAISGADALETDCARTALGKLCADPGVQSFYTSIKSELLKMLSGEDPDVVNMALSYAKLVTSRPLIVGLAGGIEVEQGPPACLFAILDAGQRKAEITEAVAKLEEMIRSEMEIVDLQVGSRQMHSLKETDDLPLYWGWVGNHLVVAVNDPKGTVMKYVQTPRAAATDHLKKVPGHGDILAVYYDVAGIWSTIETFAKAEGGGEDIKPVKAVMDQLGLSKIGRVVARVGIAGSEIVSDSFAEISGPRTGFLAAFKPLEPSVFGMVDAQAVSATAFNVDLASLFDTAMDTLKAVSPDEAYPEVQQGLAQVETELGFKVRDGLIKSLGGPVTFYALPAGKMVEAPMGGLVVIAKLNDSALFEKTMTQIGTIISKEAEGMLQISSQTDADGRTRHVWSIPPLAMAQMMPTWSIVNDQLVIGSNTPLCTMGTKQVVSKGAGANSLLETEGYKKVASKLPENLLSLSYVDSQVQFNQMMMQIQQFWPIATMAATQAGIKLPVMLPSLGHIAQEMQPAIEYSYAASNGIGSHYQGTGIEVSLRGVAGVAVGAGVMYPALARSRTQAQRVASMANLKQLSLGVIMYADENNNFPPDLAAIKRYVGSDRVLESPQKPRDFDGPSYIYISGHTPNAGRPAELMMIYENPQFREDGINAAFLDGHVEFMRPDRFREVLKRTYEALGKEAPEIRFRGEW